VLRGIVQLYGTMLIVIIVYTVAWLSFGTRMINSSLIQIHRELEEAGETSGASFPCILWRIIAPLLRPATSSLWIFTVLHCLRELSLAAFVSTPQNVTLPVVGWFLWIEGRLNGAAAVAVIIMAVLTPLLLVYLRLCQKLGDSF
jgi:iron(III) transport system permease protein